MLPLASISRASPERRCCMSGRDMTHTLKVLWAAFQQLHDAISYPGVPRISSGGGWRRQRRAVGGTVVRCWRPAMNANSRGASPLCPVPKCPLSKYGFRASGVRSTASADRAETGLLPRFLSSVLKRPSQEVRRDLASGERFPVVSALSQSTGLVRLRFWLRCYLSLVSSVIRSASACIVKGLVSTCMPGSRWPFPKAAFSA